MLEFKNNFDFSSYTLILPSVSVGNVGQFAADLIISTLKMKKVDSVWSPAIIPIIGADPYDLDSSSLMVSCELYADTVKKVAVLQLRSPLVKKHAKEFLTSLANICKKYLVKNLIVLSSSFASEMHNVSTVPYRYICNEFVQNQEIFQDLQWIDYNKEQKEGVIHGGGFAKKFYKICTELEIACLVLFKYCSEGDNIPDAIEMVDYLNQWLNLIENTDTSQKYVQPPSWTLLFGNPPPVDLY